MLTAYLTKGCGGATILGRQVRYANGLLASRQVSD